MRGEMRLATLCGVLLATSLSGGGSAAMKSEALTNLTVEYRTTPLGIDVAQPRFAWQMATAPSARGVYQTAYRVAVRDPNGAVVWDSGRVDTREALAITYQGTPLKAATRYTWTATAWNQGVYGGSRSKLTRPGSLRTPAAKTLFNPCRSHGSSELTCVSAERRKALKTSSSVNSDMMSPAVGFSAQRTLSVFVPGLNQTFMPGAGGACASFESE